MRYLCFNQAGPMIQHQAGNMVQTKAKRAIEETMENPISCDGVPAKKAKRFRSAFTTEQIKYLDAEFRKYPYIGSARRKEVSAVLNIPERAVKIWFQNRRMKEKKDSSTIDIEYDEHKHSRKIDVANDQLNNECTVTSTNNRHYASLLLMSPTKEISKNELAIKMENETLDTIDQVNHRANNNNALTSAESSIELYKQYNYRPDFSQDTSFSPEATSNPPMISPKNEVSSTSPYERVPQDLSRKKKHPSKSIRVQNTGGYFPLNLKKYYAQPSLPVANNMLWKPIQVLPLVSTGASAVSISNSHAGSLTVSPVAAQTPKKECHCDCRCHPPSPVLLQQGSPNPPLAQYVLTALPLQNPYYKY